MNKKLWFLLVFLLVALIGYFSYQYILTAGARKIDTEHAEYKLSATAIFDEFYADTQKANAKYLNKAVEISGKVTSIEKNLVIVDSIVACQLQSISYLKVESQVTIKGRITGYDDLLEELKLDQCYIIN